MNVFKVDDLLICLNNTDINGKVFVSLNIGAGFALRKVNVESEEILLGAATAKVFFNYIKLQINEKQSFTIDSDTTMNSTSLYWESDQDSYQQDIQHVLDEIFLSPINQEKLMEEKQNTIDQFKENYKSLEFRGRMKMLEFTDANKNFEFNKLSADLLEVDGEKVDFLRKYLCFADNMFLFIHGDAKQGELDQLDLPSNGKKDVEGGFSLSNWSYIQDVTLKKVSKGNYQCGSIKFERRPTNVDLSIEHAVLSIIGEILFKGLHEVKVDRVDASISYFETPLKEYKKEVLQWLTEENIESAKSKIEKKIYKMVGSKPKEYVVLAGKMFFDKVDIYHWLTAIKTIQLNQILTFLKERDFKIREGYLSYYKEESRYVI